MGNMIINESSDSLYQPSEVFLNNGVVSGECFNDFVESQKSGMNPDGSLRKGLSDVEAAELREKTVEILQHCNPHSAIHNAETTHLVVGYVQSGKTMSFTALTALAHDNGYRVVVILAGTKNNLVAQTFGRLMKDLRFGSHRDDFLILQSPDEGKKGEIKARLSADEHPTLVFPILKHYQHIDNLITLFADSEIKGHLDKETVLIIDDEADQASLNAYARSNSTKGQSRISTTYGSILRLRASLPANSYIQYTATPQANLLISMQDLLAPKSHTLLNPGASYVGGKLFFGLGEDGALFDGRLIKEIPPAEVYHYRDKPLTSMPSSLKEALRQHILAVAILVEWKKEQDFLSMMVHPETRKEGSKKFKKWTDDELEVWRRIMLRTDEDYNKQRLRRCFEKSFVEAVSEYPEAERPAFDVIWPLVKKVLHYSKTYLVNTDEEGEKEIDWSQYHMYILFGAEMLNRGFTIEKLTTTYMPRYSKGKSTADTIEQRCRFFGYKQDYIRSCRVYLPKQSIADYKAYIEHEEELRATLADSTTLGEAERRIMLSERLNPTRLNVLPRSVVNSQLRGMHAMNAFASKAYIEQNDKLVEDFLKKHSGDEWKTIDYGTPFRKHRQIELSIDDTLEFLNQFRFGNYSDAIRKSDTMRYLKTLSEEKQDFRYVYFIHMAYEAENRTRAFDFSNKIIASSFFAGRDNKGKHVYPGDEKIVGSDETLTIQLHRFHLERAPLEFPHEAYTLAIYYPERLSSNYCGNTEHYTDIDEALDDDEE